MRAALATVVPLPATTVVAGVPFAALVADRLSLPLVYSRTAPKDHGTAGRVEGSAVVGETVFLTENLITTAGKQRGHHPDIAATDYARLQRLLDEGEPFRDRYSPRAATAFLEEDGRLWRAAVKATEDGARRPTLATLHKAQPDDLARARKRRRIDREEGE